MRKLADWLGIDGNVEIHHNVETYIRITYIYLILAMLSDELEETVSKHKICSTPPLLDTLLIFRYV